jgi:hypothetical protein
MDYKDIIENIGKYHYVLVVGKKSAILGSDNDNDIAKKEALDKIKLKDGKYEDMYIVKMHISKISTKLLKQNEESKIKVIGGPIKIKIEFNNIKNGKISKLVDYNKNNKLYITDTFLKKNKNITQKIIKLIAAAAYNNKLSTKLFVINKIDNLIKS